MHGPDDLRGCQSLTFIRQGLLIEPSCGHTTLYRHLFYARIFTDYCDSHLNINLKFALYKYISLKENVKPEMYFRR